MSSKKSIVYVFWTCRDRAEAKKIIYELLEKHFIACALIFPEIESIYRWEGKVEGEGREVKVILKTVPLITLMRFGPTSCLNAAMKSLKLCRLILLTVICPICRG